MIESCAIAYLKEFFIAFMLYLIPILTYDAYSVIFTFKMKSPMPQIWQENSPFNICVNLLPNVLPSRDALDDQFQHTDEVPTGSRMK